MKVGVSGASGQLGRAVLAEIADRHAGVEAVAISRTPESVAGGVQARHGDYDHPETLRTAYAGLDRLVIIPSADLRPGVRSAQHVAAIDAAVAAGVKHIVFVSVLGTRRQEEPAIGAPFWVGEQHLIKTAPAWTIVRMGFYCEAFALEARMSAGSGVITGLGENRVAYVSRNDLAAAIAGVLAGEGHVGAIYAATGPRSLSGAERAAAATRFIGKPFGFAVVTQEQLRAGMAQAGVPQDVVNATASIQADFVAGAFDVVSSDVQRLSGRAPKTLEEVLDGLSTREG